MMIPKLKEKEHLILSCHALDLGEKKLLPAFCCKSVAWGKWLYSSLVRCFCEGCRVSENVAMCWIFCCWGIGGSHG